MQAAVIEDQTLVRGFLSAILRTHFGAVEPLEIGTHEELRRREAELVDRHLILFDIDLGDGSSLDWALARAAGPKPGAMIAVSSIAGGFPFKKLQMAGISLAHKNDAEPELINVIRQTLGGAVLTSAKVNELLQKQGRDPQAPLKLLGEKEQAVLALLGQRLRNEQVSEVLGLAVSTVADHRKRIMRKLNLHGIEEVIEYAIQHGIIYDSQAAAARVRLRKE